MYVVRLRSKFGKFGWSHSRGRCTVSLAGAPRPNPTQAEMVSVQSTLSKADWSDYEAMTEAGRVE